MKLSDLKVRTQQYMRDTSGKKFSNALLESMIQEAIDRIKAYPIFVNMPYADNVTDLPYLPMHYHYIVAVYASSRLYELDNDYYQASQRRNEFENAFGELIDAIESGNIIITDATNVTVDNPFIATESVVDEYFGTTSSDEETTIA